MKKANAIVIHEHGAPAEVVRVEEQSLPSPGPHEVLVEMRAAPINPADLNVLEGKYPLLPDLPGVPGAEGAGVIREIGSGVTDLPIGTHVLLAGHVGSWREALVLDAAEVVAIPSAIPWEQAAMLKVNPATAWRMLHDFAVLKAGDWMVQNAANSGVGISVIQIARALGIRTANVIRRPELIAPLQSEGADVVLVDGEELRAQIREATGGAKITLALNAVGGDSALRLANALAPGGTVVTYGAMSRQPLRIPNGLLIFQDLRWRGFWVSRWYDTAPPEIRAAMFQQLFPMAEHGVLKTTIERMYSINEARAAIEHASRANRGGKIMFRMGEW